MRDAALGDACERYITRRQTCELYITCCDTCEAVSPMNDRGLRKEIARLLDGLQEAA